MRDKLVIENGVPLPKPGDGKRSAVSIALSKLEVGQSFLLPKEFKITSLFRYGQAYNIKLTTRKQPSGRHRVWRKA